MRVFGIDGGERKKDSRRYEGGDWERAGERERGRWAIDKGDNREERGTKRWQGVEIERVSGNRETF